MEGAVALTHQIFITLNGSGIILIQAICQCILAINGDIGRVNPAIFFCSFDCFIEIRAGYIQCAEFGSSKIVVGIFFLYIIVATCSRQKFFHTFETLRLQMQGNGGTVFFCHQATFS